jgi:hypothetical protein
MSCKHSANTLMNTVVSYEKKEVPSLLVVLGAFQTTVWRKQYRSDHPMQAYRQAFFRLARARGIEIPKVLDA